MMMPTHLVVGGFLGFILSFSGGAGLNTFVLVGMAGGLIPDLDILLEHRKTLHRPFEFGFLSLLLVPLVLTSASVYLTLAFTFFASLSFHNLADLITNGKTRKPGEDQDERDVFNHLSGKWIHPKRYFFDGSPLDLLISFPFGIVLYRKADGILSFFIILILFLGFFYSVFRSRLNSRIPEEYNRYSSFLQNIINIGPEKNGVGEENSPDMIDRMFLKLAGKD